MFRRFNRCAILDIFKVLSIVCLFLLATSLFLTNKEDIKANTYGKESCNPDGQNTLANFLGFNASEFIEWLSSHENDDYYIGTPYLSLPLTNGEPHPNGDAKGGTPGMQCNGFVAHALNKVGANDSKFSAYGSPYGSYVYGTNVWVQAIADNDIRSYAYDTVEDLLNDGHAEKGDIIICSAKDYVCDNGVDKYGNKLDGHIGVFWGNNSSDNVFWHSYYYNNGFEQIPQINQLSHIIPKTDSDFLLIKLGNSGWIEGTKISANETITNPNGNVNSCYSRSGAVYSIYDDGWSCGSKVSEMITNEDGYMKSESLPAKTYFIKETTPAKGYALDSTVYEVQVVGGKTTKLNETQGGHVSDVPQNAKVDIILKKVDVERQKYDGKPLSQGSASLGGAKFEVMYFDDSNQKIATFTTSEFEEYKKRHAPVRTWVFVTDENGYVELDESYLDGSNKSELFRNSSGHPCLPLGTVAIREVSAPKGYINSNDDKVWIRNITSVGVTENVQTFNPLTESSIVTEDVMRGGVTIEKRDSESQLLTPLGGASLDGTMFNIRLQDCDQNEVYVDEKWYKQGQVVKTLTIENGKASSGCILPYATYTIQEVKAGEGYRLTDGEQREFSIRKQSEQIEFTSDNSFYNEIFRGDLEWVKVENGTNESYQNPLANVPFIIRSKTTGEEHVVVSDENGQVKTQSDWNKHSNKTNINDSAVSKNEEGKYIVDESKLDCQAGVWFGQRSSKDKELVMVNDTEGALPYDEYEIQELSVSSNKGYRLITRTARVYRDTTKVDLGTLTNEVEPYGGIRIYKTSSSPTTLSLEGAEFKIYTDPAMTENFLFRTIVTDENGVARTGDTFDVPGNTRYWIKESKAPTGYLCDEGRIYQAWVINQQWAQIGNVDDEEVVNTPIYGGIRIEKRDAETKESLPQGGASIDGTKFEIRNKNEYKVYVDNVLYNTNEVVKTISVKNGFAETDSKCLPYGEYEIQEIEAGEGYNLSDYEPRSFEILEDGKLIEPFCNEMSFYNFVKRGDIKLVKCYEVNHKRMANIPFLITNLSTEETYKIVTDVNGEACTTGGMLPYGKYRIEELKVEENKNCKMITIDEISIYKDNQIVDVGTLTNTELTSPFIKTSATDASDGNKTIEIGEYVVVRDTVHYENFNAGEKYSMHGILHLKDYSGTDSGAIEESKTTVEFTPEHESGVVVVDLEINTNNFGGRELVVFEECKNEDNEVIARDADITYGSQTVSVQSENWESSKHHSETIPSTGDKTMQYAIFVLIAAFSLLLLFCKKGVRNSSKRQ